VYVDIYIYNVSGFALLQYACDCCHNDKYVDYFLYSVSKVGIEPENLSVLG